MRRITFFTLILALFSISAIEPDSFCMGFCQHRYQDGIFRNEKCACIDYYPMNTTGKIDPFIRAKHGWHTPTMYSGDSDQ